MNPQKRFIIVGAGTICPGDLDFKMNPGDFLCAADAGYLTLEKAGLTPDLVVGDFDSMEAPEIPPANGKAPEILRLPVEKDDTDTVFCVKEGFRRGYTDFLLLGALGGKRLSHTLANLQLLTVVRDLGGTALIRQGGTETFLLGAGETRVFPADDPRQFPDETASDTRGGSNYPALSVFSLSDEAEISLEGLYYPLDRGIITRRFPLGVSNHFTGEEARITVHRGEILIVTER